MAASLVVLTGAGISAESGLPTFRDANGLWEGHRFEEVASPGAFSRDPHLVHRFYNMRRAALDTVQPNAAHHALVKLEEAWPGDFLLVTQNVDDLHDRAGSRQLRHMHGELRHIQCLLCGTEGIPWAGDLGTESPCPLCGKAGGLRPDIVWFGEMPRFLSEIMARLGRAGLFISIGTSGVVYPAAGFVAIARDAGARTLEVNLAETGISHSFREHRIGPATEQVPALVEALLKVHAR